MSTAQAEVGYSCKTTYDHLNIPHVETASQNEMFYCFGLHHGQDRAWEMDYFRRVAQGRNAEVLGYSHLKADLMMRLLDLPTLAEKLWRGFPTEKKLILELYARGVNQGFKQGKKTSEFLDKGYAPEEWLPMHSILVLLLQSFDQTRKTFTRDYEEELLKEKFGIKASALFDEEKMPWENTILKEGEYEKRSENLKTSYTPNNHFKFWGEFPDVFGKESGSNNWVISKKKSKTGHAILANDPHLDLKTPMFWYWIGLKSPQSKVIGASVPGVPVIASGTNGKIAWGLTNSYLNSADAVFVTDLKEDFVKSFRPVVYVKIGFLKVPFFFKTFEELQSGHKVLPLETKNDKRIVLRWSGYSIRPEEVYPLFDLLFVSDVEEADILTSKIGVPSWNYVFADSKGDIGYRLVGKTYKHTKKLPLGIPSMTYAEFLKEEFLSSSERPHLLRPERQYIYTANNRHWPSDAKIYGGRGYSHSFRGFRIDEKLKGVQDTESFQKIQCDRHVVDARFFIPLLNRILKNQEFKNWDFVAMDSSRVLPVYRRLSDILMEKWGVNEYALYKILRNPKQNEIQDIIKFHQEALLDIKGRTWGEVLRVKFPHLSKNEEWTFSPDLSGVGDTHTVDPGTAKWNKDLGTYEQTSGASMRMIIEMQGEPKIWLALPGLNREYDKKSDSSPWMNWKNCQYSEVKM
jgi:penicillin G amidase